MQFTFEWMHPHIVRFQQTVQWLSQKVVYHWNLPAGPRAFRMTRWVDTSRNLVKYVYFND